MFLFCLANSPASRLILLIIGEIRGFCIVKSTTPCPPSAAPAQRQIIPTCGGGRLNRRQSLWAQMVLLLCEPYFPKRPKSIVSQLKIANVRCESLEWCGVNTWHMDPYPADADIQYTWRRSGLDHTAACAFASHEALLWLHSRLHGGGGQRIGPFSVILVCFNWPDRQNENKPYITFLHLASVFQLRMTLPGSSALHAP